MTHLLSIVAGAILLFVMALLLNIAVPGLLPRVDTWSKRLTSLESGLEEENYQAQLALRAVANGSVMGKGPGNGTIKNNLYSAQSDFIFSSSVEEFGSIFGGVGVIFLYLVLLFRVIKIMTKSRVNLEDTWHLVWAFCLFFKP